MVVMCACVWGGGGGGHTTCAVDPLAQREALPGGCKVAALPPGDSTPLPQAQAWRGVYWQGGGGGRGGLRSPDSVRESKQSAQDGHER